MKKSVAATTFIGLFSSLTAISLLLDPRRIFNVGDWKNHLWYLEHFGQSIKHGTLPIVLNTQQLVGMPNPLFYAQKFYTMAGCLSAFLGSALTIRFLVLSIFLLQFFHVYRATVKACAQPYIANCIAMMVTWAIYPLTNLYNRSALTEFFAIAFLTCAVAEFLCITLSQQEQVSKYDVTATGLFFTLAAITHPLTALFGGLFLGILTIIVLYVAPKQKSFKWLKYSLISAFLVLLILSPWLYMVAQFKSQLITFSSFKNACLFQSGGLFSNIIANNNLSRLSPFPLDIGSIKLGIKVPHGNAPYLDAQITLPLIILLAGLVYIRHKNVPRHITASNQELSIKTPLMTQGKNHYSAPGTDENFEEACKKLTTIEIGMFSGSFALFMLTFIESIYVNAFNLGGFFNTLQFPFRLISYSNLALLVAVVVVLKGIQFKNAFNRNTINVFLSVCLTISFCAVIQKLVHGWANSSLVEENTTVWQPLPFKTRNNLLYELPKDFWSNDYAVGTIPKSVWANRIFFPVSPVNGEVEPLTVNITAPTLVITNVETFPWNHITVNGILNHPFSTINYQGNTAIFLPKGKYILHFVPLVSDTWKYLDLISWILLIIWILKTIYEGAKTQEEAEDAL